MTLTPVEQKKADDLVLTVSKDTFSSAILNDLKNYLLCSEYQLIAFMHNKGAWQGPLPLAPPAFTHSSGNIQLGLFLYWFNNPGLLCNESIQAIALTLDKGLALPRSQMTQVNYRHLCNTEMVYHDGSIISIKKWMTYDQGWFVSFISLVETVIQKRWYHNGQFPVPHTPQPLTLSGARNGLVNVALVGSWGTGDAPALAVMDKIVSLKPDYIIHLGDACYSDTPRPGSNNSQRCDDHNREVNNFLNHWPASFNGSSFTLNSGHEMYSGANSLFNDILNPPGSPFAAQQGWSCFALEFGGWTILGLDTAYNGTASDAFMSGNLGPADGPQVKWIQSLQLNPSNTIVLTHHPGIAYDASAKYELWDQVNASLNNTDPFAWYWGQTRNGIVYKRPLQVPYKQPQIKSNIFARCAGHGALPYGIAAKLHNNPNVYWQSGNPVPGHSPLVHNGFVMLTLQAVNNRVTKIIENFFDTSSAIHAPVWSKMIYKRT